MPFRPERRLFCATKKDRKILHTEMVWMTGEAFPYQGTVMLSEPGVDFTGGEFYVASKDAVSGRIVRTKVEFKNPGDLVLFRADKAGGYEHGMLPVRKGSSSNCKRVAIGLFQKK